MTGDILRLPSDLRKALLAELEPAERVLYAAMPDWRAEWGQLTFILLFALFWSSISFAFFGASLAGLTGTARIMSGDAPASPMLLATMLCFSIPFVAIGCVLLAVPFLSVRKSRNTVHAITDARLLNVFIGRDRGTESYPLQKINFVKRRDRRAGFGSLEIGCGVEKDADGDPRPLTLSWPGIPDAKRAHGLIRAQAKLAH